MFCVVVAPPPIELIKFATISVEFSVNDNVETHLILDRDFDWRGVKPVNSFFFFFVLTSLPVSLNV